MVSHPRAVVTPARPIGQRAVSHQLPNAGSSGYLASRSGGLTVSKIAEIITISHEQAPL